MDEHDINKKLLVAVHAGAGYHSNDMETNYNAVCKKACVQAMSLLKERKSAMEAVTAAVIVLENAEITNAGRGSSLTINSTVECDASLMEGLTGTFGAVGCLSGILNPVRVAHKLVDCQRSRCLSLGRIHPSVLVGEGAKEWARQQGIEVIDDNQLLTEKSEKLYRKYKRRVENAEKDSNSRMKKPRNDLKIATSIQETGVTLSAKHEKNCENKITADSQMLTLIKHSAATSLEKGISLDTDMSFDSVISRDRSIENETFPKDKEMTDQLDDPDTPQMQDTVGAVCMDWQGHLAAAVSSGGIWLKHPGRLGAAAMYGTGCWAQDPVGNHSGVAIITSGCGEHLMRTLLAKTCADHIKLAENASLGLSSCFNSEFLGSHLLSSVDNKLGGALALKTSQAEKNLEVELVWGHTTESMAVGYMWGENEKPKINDIDNAIDAITKRLNFIERFEKSQSVTEDDRKLLFEEKRKLGIMTNFLASNADTLQLENTRFTLIYFCIILLACILRYFDKSLVLQTINDTINSSINYYRSE